jgi:hypothetical protein
VDGGWLRDLRTWGVVVDSAADFAVDWVDGACFYPINHFSIVLIENNEPLTEQERHARLERQVEGHREIRACRQSRRWRFRWPSW